jgi:hypothetical protein
VIFDLRKREIRIKIVYYGPSFSGKTTNLMKIYEGFPGKRGKLLTLNTKGERTLLFDFLPLELSLFKGFQTRFYVFTVPGQVFYKGARKLVLKGADGIVFVADSQSNRLEENVESLEEMYQNMEELGLRKEKVPIVFQYNKRDLPDISSVEELERALNPKGYPYFEAIAIDGKGVFITLERILRVVVETLLVATGK